MCSTIEILKDYNYYKVTKNQVSSFSWEEDGIKYIMYTDNLGNKAMAYVYGEGVDELEYPMVTTEELINKAKAYENNLELYL